MAGFPIEVATRIKTLPPYLFAAIDKMKQAAIAKGVDIINLGIGDPDLPTPTPIIDSLAQAAKNPKHHQYPSYEGMLSFRKAVADWYKRRFNVTLDPANEVLTLIGSKEGIGHIHLALRRSWRYRARPEPWLSRVSGRHQFLRRGLAPHAADEGERVPARSEGDPERRREKSEVDVAEFPEQPDVGHHEQGLLQARRRVRAGEPGHRLSRRGLFGDLLRRQASCELHGNRRSQGRRGGVPLALEDVQHDRLAHRLCRRPQGCLGGARQGEEQPRLRRVRSGAGRRDHGAGTG